MITIKGTAQVGEAVICHIEGGFGPDVKALLVKDIAGIHGRDLKCINHAIHRNRKRFKDGLHIIDLKGTGLEFDLIELGIYSQNSVNASKYIYALSEQGYTILLKILRDDVAWDFLSISKCTGVKVRQMS